MEKKNDSKIQGDLNDTIFRLSSQYVSITAMIIYVFFCMAYLGSGIYFTFKRGAIDLMGIGLGIVFGAVAIVLFFRYRKIGLEMQ
jgi:hypothetical protein